ncbi:MAG: HAMP domain-containing sensor histidine kinase [Pseudomonadota bacterium]
MRMTVLFGIYASTVFAMVLGLCVLTLYSINKARYWEERTELAQEAYGLHLELEVNIFRLFKQNADALLIGDRDQGVGEEELGLRIAANLADIRAVIAKEIDLVGEEEIEELELLERIEDDVREITTTLASMSATGESLDGAMQVERLALLLDRRIDEDLDRKITAALEEEREEVEEVKIDAAAFRRANQNLIIGFVALSLALLVSGIFSFNRKFRTPLISLRDTVAQLRSGRYDQSIRLKGSAEFQELEGLLQNMADELAKRELSREETEKGLEQTIEERTSELQRLLKQMERSEESRKRLMADISHELRTPIAIVLGEAEVTLRTAKTLDDNVSDTLARIRDAAKHTNQIVDDMLTVARQEAGELRLDRRKADVRKVLHDAVELFPGDVELDMPTEPKVAQVDEVRLRQSILAVLQNARRYGGPNIFARLSEESQNLLFVVEDNGPGMPDEEKAQAFTRFFRGSNAAGQVSEGTGLGLPIVKAIVEAHGGTVHLEDVETGGLRVVIALPATHSLRAVSSSGTSRHVA